MDWIETIGWQHEVLHTGVLAHLLSGSAGPRFAAALTGMSAVTAVSEVCRERRLRDGSRRPVDLAAELIVDGRPVTLGVEVKVDAGWTPAQLRETVPEDAVGVLLTLGRTALAVTPADMAALDGYKRSWSNVGPGAFAALISEHAGHDRELVAYAERLRREAEEHARALEAVRSGSPVSSRRDPDTALGHWAYFHEVVRRRLDAPAWDRKSLISGPLMTHWMPDRQDGTRDYLEFMGEGGSRALCVKTQAPVGTGLLDARRAELIRALSGLGAATVKRPSRGAKTCTALKFDLDDKAPAEASALADDLIGRLSRHGVPGPPAGDASRP